MQRDQLGERRGVREREMLLEVLLYIDTPESLCGPGCIMSHLLCFLLCKHCFAFLSWHEFGEPICGGAVVLVLVDTAMVIGAALLVAGMPLGCTSTQSL